MRKIRSFKCSECELVEERFCDDSTQSLECTECNSVSNLALSMPKYFGNAEGTRSPSAVN